MSGQPPPSPAAVSPPAPWQRELATAFTDAGALLDFLGIEPAGLPTAATRIAGFPLLVPRGFAGQMRHGDPADPLLRQVLPTDAELAPTPGFVADPLSEQQARTPGGLLRKYQGRALLLASAGCAVHCRYCFRRHDPYQATTARNAWDAPLAELRAATDLSEVILSGGDPLLLSDDALANLLGRLAPIAHLRRLRIHTRLPVVLPSRVTEALCAMLSDQPQRCVVVLHVNHSAELGQAQTRACEALKRSDATLLNQSVLLSGVNDAVETLRALSERLFECGVLPYYLHQLDQVAGAGHFAVDDHRARALSEQLRAVLPGYLTPLLVRETVAAPNKEPLA